ncbi:MAG TPA: isoprenylcysteine carboxylmethyltransferase family protein, partial [Anaerolineae bacterium]|nr:isoprenylcysteine carboxylmethyltransferase family protein [Anaerolineae bacterium]
MHRQKNDTAGLPLPPPFIVLGFLIAGLILSALFPIDLLPFALRLLLGAALVAIGFFIALRAFQVMMSADTPIDPFEPTTAIV